MTDARRPAIAPARSDSTAPQAAPDPGPLRAPTVAVGAVVFERSDEGPRVLLVRRGRPPNQGSWTLPGGRVERGERIADALRRELHEETGLLVRPGPLVAVVELITDTHHYVIHDHACEPEGGVLRAGDDAAEVAFVPIPSLSSFGVTDAVHDVVARALALPGASISRGAR